MAASLIPPQIHTFCMETEAPDVAFVASRLYYAAVAAGQETNSPDEVDRAKYEALAKALIPTLSIRRPSPMAEGQVCKSLGSIAPAPDHKAFEPAQYKDIPTMENPQAVAEEKAAVTPPVPPVQTPEKTSETSRKEVPPTTETEVTPAAPTEETSHLD